MTILIKPILLLATVFQVFNCAASPTTSSQQLEEIATVFIAKLPHSLTFAGEKVPLQYSDVREALEREMGVTMYMHSRTMQTLRATTRYFPVIEPILKKYGIPDDFKYLCMAESGLNPNAASSAGARGFWQFVSSASKDFGLETGDNIDMRYDLEKSTIAACRYLKKAYERYGNWTMAAASYNVGMAGVSNRSEKQMVDNYYDLFLPEETMRYVFRILTFKIITEKPADYGFIIKPDNYLKPFRNYREVEVSSPTLDWSAIAAKHGTNYKVLRILNPWIRSYSYSNPGQKSYTIKVPTGQFRELGQ